MKRFNIKCVLLGLNLAVGNASAEMLQLDFMDGVGDPIIEDPQMQRQIDLVSLRLVFDNVTGDYQVTFKTTADHPLLGAVQLNVNLMNGDLPFDPGSGLDIFSDNLPPAFFSDTFNDFQFDVGLTSLTLSGTDANLIQWRAGDRIATDSYAFTAIYPNGVFADGDLITAIQYDGGFDIFNESETIAFITSAPVPVPGTLPLLASAVWAMGYWRRQAPPA